MALPRDRGFGRDVHNRPHFSAQISRQQMDQGVVMQQVLVERGAKRVRAGL